MLKKRIYRVRIRIAALVLSLLTALAAASVCAFASASLPVYAAEQIDSTGVGSGYSKILYNAGNGLPTSEANAIVQTDDGFIWVGAYSGLIRYDGNEFYRYTSAGIASVVSLYSDSRNRLWIGTNDSGVAVFYDNAFTFYGKKDGLGSSSVRSIAEDPDGNILIATTNGLSYVDGDGVMGRINDTLINNEYICELFTGNDGIVYGVTLTGKVLTIENKKVTVFIKTADTEDAIINTVYPDPDRKGYVYLGTQGSDIYYGNLADDLSNYSVLTAREQTTINAIRKINGLLWVCADNGVGYFDAENNYVRLLDLPMTNSIDHLMQDYEGNFWFTSSRQGVMKITRNRFNDISGVAKLPALIVNSTCKCGDDLYIGTDTGLYILDKNNQTAENAATAALSGVRIRCVKRGDGGKVYFCTYGAKAMGLVCYDPATDKLTAIDKAAGMTSDHVRMFTERSDGSLAVATNAGLSIVKDGVVTDTYDAKDHSISNLEILCVEEAADKTLYLGSDGDGIYKIDGSKVTRIGSDEGLASEVILRIKKDPGEDLYWIITSNSIAYMKNDRVTTIDGFPYSNNFDLYFDDFGRVWILSSNGIYVVKRENLLSSGPIEYTHYNADWGMPGIATANSYSYQDTDGTLYVAATTGVFSVNINEIDERTENVKLAIPFVTADDQTIWIHNQSEIHIPSSCKRLNIYANAMTYTLSNPHLRYRLENFDEQPIETTKRDMTYASYTNLSGGTYRFILEIVDEITGETEQQIAVTIIKDKAVYETLWFKILLIAAGILILVGLFLLLYRRKTAKLLKKQEEDRRLINEMTRVFSGCIDMKDAYTNGHSARVAKYTSMIAKKMGKSDKEVADIYNIALLHDIGKIGIPDNILNKPGRLTDEEYTVMKTHASRGGEILKDITIAPDIALGAAYHHEKYDGTGYPAHLKGDEIPEIAQMIAVADAFDAMYSNRPYRRQLPLETVLSEIERCNGTQFSPKIVEVFFQLAREGAFDERPEAAKPKDENGQAHNPPAERKPGEPAHEQAEKKSG